MNVGTFILIFAIMLAAPMILVSVYDNLCDKMEVAAEGNPIYKHMQYFVWSIATVSFVADLLMLSLDGSTIFSNIRLYPNHKDDHGYHDIYIYFILFAVALFLMIAGDILVMGIAIFHLGNKKEFPIPELLKFFKKILCCCGYCRKCRPCGGTENQPLQGGRKTDSGSYGAIEGGAVQDDTGCFSDHLILLFGCVSFTLFIQMISFHFMYILLGTMCTPVTTLSITSFYTATYFCLVTFFAVFLKSTNDENLYKKFQVPNCIKCVTTLTSASLFITTAVLFVLYFYKYTVMVQEYQNGNGILGIVGSILPSFLIAFGGWCCTRLIKYI